MSHMPRARRFALAALVAGALVASPTLSAPSWAGERTAESRTSESKPVVVDDSSGEFKANKAKASRKAAPKKAEIDCRNPLVGTSEYGWRGKLIPSNPAAWTFTVKPGCSFTGGLDSWKLRVPRFVTEQTHQDREAGTYGPGEHTLTVDRPRCWQLDGYRGTQSTSSIWYKSLLVTHIGGTEPCEEKPVPPVDEEKPVPPVDEEKPVPPVREETPVKQAPAVPPAKRIVAKTPAPKKAVKKAPAPSQTMNALPFTGAGTTQAMMLLVGLALITAGALGLKLIPRGVHRG